MSQVFERNKMSQCEMLPVVEVCQEAAAAKRAAENAKWEMKGRAIGTLTCEQIKRNALPKWAWDDYSI